MTIVLQPLNAKLLKNFDNTFDGLFPNGDKTPGLSWNASALPSLTGRSQGVTASFNARAILQGDSNAVATALITVVFVTGSDSSAWSNPGAGNTCTNVGSLVSSGSFLLRATYLGLTIDSPPLSWSFIGSGTTPTGGHIKFNPGAYIYLNRNTSVDSKKARMAYFSAFSFIRGFQDIIFWSQLENPNVQGDYSGNWDASGNSGFKYFDSMLALCKSLRPSDPMSMMWNISPYGFQGSNLSATKWPTSFVPLYLQGSTYGPNQGNPAAVESSGKWGGIWINTTTQTTLNGGRTAYYYTWWEQNVMTALLALMNAYAQRYDNAVVSLRAPNSDRLEMMSWLSESVTALYTGYSDAKALTQYGRYFPQGRAMWPTTQLRYWGANLQSAPNALIAMRLAIASQWAIGGPDCTNETPIKPGDLFRGYHTDKYYRGIDAVTGVADPTLTNYVGKGAWVSEFEPDEQGPRAGGPGPATLGNNNWTDYIAHANMQGAQYTTWFDNNWTGNNDKRFTQFLDTQPAHPTALDWLNSLANGGTVNGATANIRMANNKYPTLWP